MIRHARILSDPGIGINCLRFATTGSCLPTVVHFCFDGMIDYRLSRQTHTHTHKDVQKFKKKKEKKYARVLNVTSNLST